MGLLRGQDPATSKDIPIYADADSHALLTKSVGAGAPGSANTTEVTQLLVKTAVQDLDTAMGAVTASPVANTLLGRLKDLLTGIILAAGSNLIGKVSIDQTTQGTTNAVTINRQLTNVKTTAYAASLILSATPKTLFTLTITNSKASGQFIQLHNSATLPADTAVPEQTIYIGPLTTIVIDFGVNGYYWSTGCVVCNSSTGPTKTIDSADCWFNGQVI
jgi:hypothetical protein